MVVIKQNGIPGGAIKFTSVKIAAYDILADEHIQYDPTAGGFTLKLPPTAATNTQVGFKNCSTSTNSVTIDGNGHNVENPSTPGATVASFVTTTAGLSIICQFNGTEWWII